MTPVSTPITLSGSNAIQVSDVDAASSSIRITLTATNGTMTLASTTGLTFTTGDGTADGTIVVTGTVANLNAALDGLTFSPTAAFNGTGTITVLTEDLGNTGSGGSLSDSDVLNIQIGPLGSSRESTAIPARKTRMSPIPLQRHRTEMRRRSSRMMPGRSNRV